ncbi:hypothetical protein [Sporomusa silvacetica]|uniref:hypothetical protein n=1 Tax=Sporomusa silvacetica TaxID=55504 RepID=UPI000B99DD54|nr:hypothetical protein [Sporomusa silvacetica]
MAGSRNNVVAKIKEINQINKDHRGANANGICATEEQSASMEEIASSSQSLAKLAEDLTWLTDIIGIVIR